MAGLLVSWEDALIQVSQDEELVEREWLVSIYNGETDASLHWPSAEAFIAALEKGGVIKEVQAHRYQTVHTSPPLSVQ